MEVEADGGRIYLPKDLRDRLGERFELVDRGEDLLLVPIPDDPLEALREEWGDVDESVAELTRDADEQAEEDAGR
jgi:bifunctional DNA-binding transcriptional regulator/antitoxin component of YhaV-PrlF toxin-antitoxin module